MSSGLELKPPSEPPSLEGLGAEERVEAIAEWFHSNFEDPAQETPYDGREGGYQYIWGGPYDAREEVESVFSEASEDEIEAAVDEIQATGLFEWAPSGNRIQPDDYPDDYSDELDISDGPLDQQLDTLGGRLDVVEAWLNAIQSAAAQFGHNQPPPEFQMLPDEGELAAVRESIAELRNELVKPDPANQADLETVGRAFARFQGLWKFVKRLVIGGAALFAAAYVQGAGEEAWQNPAAFRDHVASVARTLSDWTANLQLPL